jgi:hypothetical protein
MASLYRNDRKRSKDDIMPGTFDVLYQGAIMEEVGTYFARGVDAMQSGHVGRRELQTIVAIFAGMILALGVTSADAGRARVTNLRSGALHNRDLPAGFVVGRLLTYKRFNTVITVKIGVRGATLAEQSAVCSTPAGVTQKGFEQGLLEAFVNTGAHSRLVVCGWRFHANKRAHSVFAVALSKAGWWDQLKKGVYHQLKTSALGDEAFGIRAKASNVPRGSHQPTRNYVVLFRHANAFFSIEYLGTSVLSPKRFVRLARVIDSRLH